MAKNVDQAPTRGHDAKSKKKSKAQKRTDKRDKRIDDAFFEELDKHAAGSWDDSSDEYRAAKKKLGELFKKGPHKVAIEKGILKGPKPKRPKPKDATVDPIDKLMDQLKELQEHLTPEEEAQLDSLESEQRHLKIKKLLERAKKRAPVPMPNKKKGKTRKTGDTA